MPKKWKGLFNYILPSPPSNEYEIDVYDEEEWLYMWCKNETEFKRGFKSYYFTVISVWLHKWFGWYI